MGDLAQALIRVPVEYIYDMKIFTLQSGMMWDGVLFQGHEMRWCVQDTGTL